jgi:hypothetical protein
MTGCPLPDPSGLLEADRGTDYVPGKRLTGGIIVDPRTRFFRETGMVPAEHGRIAFAPANVMSIRNILALCTTQEEKWKFCNTSHPIEHFA